MYLYSRFVPHRRNVCMLKAFVGRDDPARRSIYAINLSVKLRGRDAHFVPFSVITAVHKSVKTDGKGDIIITAKKHRKEFSDAIVTDRNVSDSWVENV